MASGPEPSLSHHIAAIKDRRGADAARAMLFSREKTKRCLVLVCPADDDAATPFLRGVQK